MKEYWNSRSRGRETVSASEPVTFRETQAVFWKPMWPEIFSLWIFSVYIDHVSQP